MTREELLVNAKPILFNTEMVKAILDGRKTVTRRVVKLPKWVKEEDKELNTFYFSTNDRGDSGVIDMQGLINYLHLNPYKVGDILYVRETYQPMVSENNETVGYHYNADGLVIWIDGKNGMTANHIQEPLNWKPSIHMPKEAARLFLKVTNVRVERLQEIRPSEIIMEGVCEAYEPYENIKSMFEKLWNSTINKKDLDSYGWEADPYVWVIDFEKVNYE